MHHGVLDAAAAPAQQLIQGLAGILDEVVPVGRLDRLGRALSGGIRERARPIAYEHLHAWMRPQPGRDRLGCVATE
jgi:hypothetical protein